MIHKAQGDTEKAKELLLRCAEGYEAQFGVSYEWARKARDVLKML